MGSGANPPDNPSGNAPLNLASGTNPANPANPAQPNSAPMAPQILTTPVRFNQNPYATNPYANANNIPRLSRLNARQRTVLVLPPGLKNVGSSTSATYNNPSGSGPPPRRRRQCRGQRRLRLRLHRRQRRFRKSHPRRKPGQFPNPGPGELATGNSRAPIPITDPFGQSRPKHRRRFSQPDRSITSLTSLRDCWRRPSRRCRSARSQGMVVEWTSRSRLHLQGPQRQTLQRTGRIPEVGVLL